MGSGSWNTRFRGTRLKLTNCQRGKTLLLCHTQEAETHLWPFLFPLVSMYYKAIEKDQLEVPLMLLQTQARKGSH